MDTAVILAIVASFFWGIGTAMQKHGIATEFPQISLRNFFRQIKTVLKTLIRNWVWSVGFLMAIGGMAAFAYALAHGDIVVVMPLVNLTMVVAAFIGVIFLGEKVAGIEWFGIAFMLIGAVLVSVAGGGPTSQQPSAVALGVVTMIFTVLIIGSLFLEKISPRFKAEFTLALGAGLCFGIANVMGKVLTQKVIAEVGEFSLVKAACLKSIFMDYPIWIVVIANIFGVSFFQTALANGRVSLVSPMVTIMANSTPIVVAIVIFSESMGVLRSAGIVIIIVGTALLAFKNKDAHIPNRTSVQQTEVLE